MSAFSDIEKESLLASSLSNLLSGKAHTHNRDSFPLFATPFVSLSLIPYLSLCLSVYVSVSLSLSLFFYPLALSPPFYFFILLFVNNKWFSFIFSCSTSSFSFLSCYPLLSHPSFSLPLFPFTHHSPHPSSPPHPNSIFSEFFFVLLFIFV